MTTKTALIIFNKETNFSRVIRTVPTVVQKHPNYISDDQHTLGETAYRFCLRNREDEARRLITTAIAFNIPALTGPTKG